MQNRRIRNKLYIPSLIEVLLRTLYDIHWIVPTKKQIKKNKEIKF